MKYSFNLVTKIGDEVFTRDSDGTIEGPFILRGFEISYKPNDEGKMKTRYDYILSPKGFDSVEITVWSFDKRHLYKTREEARDATAEWLNDAFE